MVLGQYFLFEISYMYDKMKDDNMFNFCRYEE